MLLGAGRSRLDTAIDLGVGLTVHAKIGDKVERDSPLVTIHSSNAPRTDDTERDILEAYNIGPEPVEPPALIKAVLR
jgi:pyrimidine-nucleoside phosphorylase